MHLSTIKIRATQFMTGDFSALIVSLIRLFLIGSCLGLATQLLLVWQQLPDFFIHNRINETDRLLIASVTIGSGVLAVTVAILMLCLSATSHGLRKLRAFSSFYYPLVAAPLLVILLNPSIFEENKLLALIMILLLAVIFEYSLRISVSEGGAARPNWVDMIKQSFLEIPTYVPPLLLAVMVVGFVAYFSHYSILNHYRFQSFSFDLGLYDNMMWNLLRGEWFKSTPLGPNDASHFPYHAEFGAYILAPLYALRQQADTLLFIQAMLAGGTLIPVYLIARSRLNNAWLALTIAYVFAIYPPLHGPLFYDFHFLTVAVFFIAWVIYFYEKENLKAVVIATILASLWREDIGPGLSMVGFYYLLTSKKSLWAINLITLPLLYFFLMKFYIMPQSAAHTGLSESHIWAYADFIPAGKNSMSAVILTLVTNPAYVLKHLLDMDKLIYILQLFIPLLFLPLRTPVAWVMLIPAAGFTLLATGYAPLYQISFQYTAYWMVYLFFALIICLYKWQQDTEKNLRLTPVIYTMILISTITSLHYGAIFQHKTFHTGMSKIVFDYSDADHAQYTEFRSLAKLIPDSASVAATETEVPHLSNRSNSFTLRLGYSNADYILARLSTIENDKASKQALVNALNSKKYKFIGRTKLFSLWGPT